jgi:hypothetical protein
MHRRTFLESAASASTLTPSADRTEGTENDAAVSFFEPLGELDEATRGELVVDCANALCVADELPSSDVETLVSDITTANTAIRRVRFAVRALNEYNLTRVIDESMIEEISDRATPVTRFTPLFGSYRNLQATACAIGSNLDPDSVRAFLFACLAFGLEVILWHRNLPYQMAWNGTRFATPRSFLRYANGCSSCIAAVMSELHWALRAV